MKRASADAEEEQENKKMSFDSKKFNAAFPADKMKKAIEEAKKNENNSKLPDGQYTVQLERLELGESRTGAAMIKSMFRIIKGDHKNQCIFVNKVLTGTKNDGFMMHKANEFLESLDSGIDEITFENWEQYDEMIKDVFDYVREDGIKYLVCLSANEKNPQYQDFEIIDIIE